jgi:hypothetical protein
VSRVHLGTFDLHDRRADQLIPAELYGDIAPSNVNDFVDKWRPVFDERREQIKSDGDVTAEVLRKHGLEDAHWKWPEKAAAVAKQGTVVGFSLEAAGVTQGLMIAVPYGFGRHDVHKGLPLTRVELISTAPWNRPQFSNPPIYKGVGRTLLSAAISLSIDEEHGGRIGLHALKGAEGWYRDHCKMLDLGFDSEKNMQYFEMNAEMALEYIS